MDQAVDGASGSMSKIRGVDPRHARTTAGAVVDAACMIGAAKLAGSLQTPLQSTGKVRVYDVQRKTSTTSKWQSRYWSEPRTVNLNGKDVRVYQRNDFFDPHYVDDLGKSNIQRMNKGLAPLGHDGMSVNLHHLTQTEKDALAEISQRMHTKYDRVLHINPKSWPSGIDRSIFNQQRKEYWKLRGRHFE